MSRHEHHLAHSTNRNTRRLAESNDDILDIQRRSQLESHGLIDFNAPAGVVRAVERRLAIERGEPVRRFHSPTTLTRIMAWAGGMGLLGLVLTAVVAPVGLLVVLGAALLLTYCLAERTASRSLEADREALAAYDATRRRQIEG